VSFFNIHSIFFEVLGYSMSYLEFFGALAGAIAVWLSAKGNIWSWPIGIVNVTLLFFLFFQVQLYPDMFLQVFFFVTNLLGWWRWANPKPGEEDKKNELKVSHMRVGQLFLISFAGIAGTLIVGRMADFTIGCRVFSTGPARFLTLIPLLPSSASSLPF